MGRSSAAARTVQVEIPEEAFQHRTWEPREIAREMRALWLLEEVRLRRLGWGKAAELADMPVADFLRLMGAHQVTPFDYDADELARELGA
jgi:predicted HTH domain antitoxin